MLEVKVKYFDGATELEKKEVGDWIDVYSNEDITLRRFESAKIHLGFAMEFPPEYEAHLVPRSSTFDKWGIIQTNHTGIIDHTYCGDNDEWKLPVYCLEPRHIDKTTGEPVCTIIRKGDKIAQFRLIKRMEDVNLNTVEKLGNKDRGGFGSTGSTK